jgi:hypothetical protein
VGSVYRVKRVDNWVEKFCQGRSKVADIVRPDAEVAAGFDAVEKRWDDCINVCGGYVEK